MFSVRLLQEVYDLENGWRLNANRFIQSRVPALTNVCGAIHSVESVSDDDGEQGIVRVHVRRPHVGVHDGSLWNIGCVLSDDSVYSLETDWWD